MTTNPQDHCAYIERHGLARWLLRECVRANPLYVISAALLCYGVLKLNQEIDPQIGKAGGIVLALLLLNLYEFAVLIVATIVLRHRQPEGGGDLHGLMLVAALFLGGSLLALDELITLWPGLGWVLIPAALLLIAGKLAWYARLPGLNLPLRFRNVVLMILAADALSPLWGYPDTSRQLSLGTLQGLAWLPGWVSLLSVLWLIRYEHTVPASGTKPGDCELDVLRTRWCGAWAVIVATMLGLAHLIASDWIFDRPFDLTLSLTCVVNLVACAILLLWQRGRLVSSKALLLLAVPALAANWAWGARPAWQSLGKLDVLTCATCQVFLAAGLAYAALAWATRQRAFLLGIVALFPAPCSTWLGRAKHSIPHFRALASSALGFVFLVLGMILSLYPKRLLRWLDAPAAE